MKEEIEKLLLEKQSLLERVKKIDNAIEAFQEVCDHKTEYKGNDSHYDYHECTICKYIDKI